jgi:hypothetical protein
MSGKMNAAAARRRCVIRTAVPISPLRPDRAPRTGRGRRGADTSGSLRAMSLAVSRCLGGRGASVDAPSEARRVRRRDVDRTQKSAASRGTCFLCMGLFFAIVSPGAAAVPVKPQRSGSCSS